jgi:tRNA(fMet)-specific endonuclease VapC
VKLASTPRNEVAVSTITKAELFYGSSKSQTPERSRQKQIEFLTTVISLPFDDAAAIIYGPLRFNLEQQETPISQNDMLIATVALTHGLILVTHNVREFSRIQGLNIEDWEI